MKKNYTLIIAVLLLALTASAQTTTTFRINANDEDATIDNYNPSGNYPNEIEYNSGAWTISSVPVIWRNVFKFDLSCIPPSAIVQQASLSLYYAAQNSYGNDTHHSLTNSDESVLQRATSAWSENTVTWNNQPSTTNTDEVILPQSTSATQDYTNMNVTAMVQQMINTSNYGFLLKLTNEVEYARLLFESGDNPDSSKHPMLSVTYIVPGVSCVTLRLHNNGEDATIDNYNPSGNYPNEIEYNSGAWTISSVPVIWRNFFKFEMPCAIYGATIQSAHLSLYYAPQNSYGNDTHHSLTNSDESVLQRITSAWSENTVTWNNQPSTTTANEYILPQSTSATQDYTNMDVTAMVQQMVSTNNYGFLLKLTNEVEYARLLFGSGDNPDTSKHPMLEICYSFPTGVDEIADENNFVIYPNPTEGQLTIDNGQLTMKSVEIYNTLGEKIYTETPNIKLQTLNLKLSSGIYFVKLTDAEKSAVKKLVVE